MNHFGFPVWISATHYLNLLFMAFLARSGIQILASFPRLYLKDDCAPGHEKLHKVILLGEMGKPEGVAEVALFLASDRSRYVTGSTYCVDGGMVRYAEAV